MNIAEALCAIADKKPVISEGIVYERAVKLIAWERPDASTGVSVVLIPANGASSQTVASIERSEVFCHA